MSMAAINCNLPHFQVGADTQNNVEMHTGNCLQKQSTRQNAKYGLDKKYMYIKITKLH